VSEDPTIADALPHAAEALLRRRLTFKEVKQLRKYFDAAIGSTSERSQAALQKFTGLSPEEMKQRADGWRGSEDLTPQTLKWMV